MDCRIDFEEPNIVNEPAELYEAHFNETFNPLERRIPLSAIWTHTRKTNKQHSIQELDMEGIGKIMDLPSGDSISGKKGYQRLPSSELNKVCSDHIWNAVNKLLDGFEDHLFGPSTDYDILTDCGKLLPPKAVFGLAASEALGFKVEPKHFSGGLETTCFKILKQSGFNIVRKKEKGTASPRIPIPSEDREWSEGNPKRVSHLKRERASGLSQAKKDHFKREHGKLFCERCGLDPVSSYGGLHGEACIEAHHMNTSVATMGEDHMTKLEDLQCLCANCHRVIHRLQA
jgi:5-methylcytosine-specific restriction protein A